MRAAYYSRNGGPEVLQYGLVPDPVVGEDEVLIRVAYVSLEGGDLRNRRAIPPSSPMYVGGYQVSGIVEAIGKAVTRVRIGDSVAAFNWAGSHAELFVAPERYVFPVQADMDLSLAATIPVAFGTASDALFEFGNLRAGETVLVQGAAGGVGIAAVQLAHKAGARVIGTASNRERLEALARYGLHHGINYRQEDIGARCLELTDGKGVDLIIDLAGGHSTGALIESVSYRGRIAVIGVASGDLSSFSFPDLVRKTLHVYGISFGREMHTPRAHRLIRSLSERVAAGDLEMPIARRFPLSKAIEAHSYAETAHPFGRVLMTP